MVRRKESVSSRSNMFCSLDPISDPFESLLNDSPRSTMIVPLKVPDIFKDQVFTFVPFQNIDDFMKQRALRWIGETLLKARF